MYVGGRAQPEVLLFLEGMLAGDLARGSGASGPHVSLSSSLHSDSLLTPA